MQSFFVLVCFVAACLGQSINIAAPLINSTVSAGQNITVEIDRPVCIGIPVVRCSGTDSVLELQRTLSASEEVALVLSMVSCSPSCTDPSYDPSSSLGDILYNGLFDPEDHPVTPPDHKPPYQNFTVQVPTSFTSGEEIALIATHFTLVGAGPQPIVEVKFLPLEIV
ncbi:hypothetical protein PHLCEN_2v4391 [Hermanssonia centrifuga]|uniref:Uncharacterized protein n=1 Tax=Hermanssonia centrifuga TaxID=98765 RepID=A0A2R6PNP7_9APHY|nr:hypothetical protein PHLCEN_2v4391 [Hermanssonia centrifuga]